GLLHLRNQRRHPQPAGVKKHSPGHYANDAKEAEQTEDATDEPDRDPADSLEKPCERMVRRPRMRGGSHHSAGPDLIKYGCEIRPKIPELDDVALRRQLVFGPQQQPGARG